MATQDKYTSKLAGQSVLIIGGTSGLGYGLAEACLENYAGRVILSSSRQHSIDTAIQRLQASYPQSSTVLEGHPCDLGTEATLESNVEGLFSKIVDKLDHIVFTAGDVLTAVPLAQLTLSALKQAGMVRFFAPFFVAKHAVSYLNPGPASSFTLTTGAAGDRPVPGMPAVSAFSAGLHGLIRSLALEMRPVRVNLVSPSAVDTELWARALGHGSEERKAAMFAHHRSTVATGQVGQVEDVVESFLYLLKDKNVTGTIIRSDGGYLIM